MNIFFLSSGLFLGWSLGANDAANVFGTAVGTNMVRFKTAALICSIFVILGAVIGGAGAAHTLGTLGSVNAIAGAFVVASSAALTVFWMSKLKVPVSTSQAIVGAIIGWNFYSKSLTDYGSLLKIVVSWACSPVLAALFAMGLFLAFKAFFTRAKIHLLELDMYTRLGLVLVGAFGSYSLGANNIANVMGVFMPVSSLSDLHLFGLFTLSNAQQLFLLGGLAIAVGVFTYSRKVMETVGGGLFKLSPEAALVVVLANALVLFLFSSQGLETWLLTHGLPAIPLVPVSSSQAVIGAVLGIGLLKGARGINYGVLGEIATGWVTTPIIAGIITFVALFFVQNVFKQQVSRKTIYSFSEEVLTYLNANGIDVEPIRELKDREFDNPIRLQTLLGKKMAFTPDEINMIIGASERHHFFVDATNIAQKLDTHWLTKEQTDALRKLTGHSFDHKWQFRRALQQLTAAWQLRSDTKINKLYNKTIKEKLEYVFDLFKVEDEASLGP